MSCMIEPSHSEISNFDGRVRKWHIYININIYIYTSKMPMLFVYYQRKLGSLPSYGQIHLRDFVKWVDLGKC